MQVNNSKPTLTLADPVERMAALEAFVAKGDVETTASAAARFLLDTDPGVRETAARILMNQGDEAAARHTAPLIASKTIEVRNLAGEILGAIGRPAVTALTPQLHHPDKDVRKFALDVLAVLPSHAVSGSIALCLHDVDINVVLAATDALARVGDERHAAELRELFYSEPLARPNIIEALGHFRMEGDLPLFERALGDENPVVQLASAEALARNESTDVLRLLCNHVDGLHPMAMAVVLRSIVNYCRRWPEHIATLPHSIREHLIEMLDDPEREFVYVAVQGLAWFLDEEVVGLLLSRSTDDATAAVIFDALQSYPMLSKAIVNAADSGRMPANVAATFMLALLAQQVPEESDWEPLTTVIQAYYPELDADTKLAAIDVSIRMRNPGLYRILRTALADPDPTVCSFAADAALDVGLVTEQEMLELNPRTDL